MPKSTPKKSRTLEQREQYHQSELQKLQVKKQIAELRKKLKTGK